MRCASRFRSSFVLTANRQIASVRYQALLGECKVQGNFEGNPAQRNARGRCSQFALLGAMAIVCISPAPGAAGPPGTTDVTTELVHLQFVIDRSTFDRITDRFLDLRDVPFAEALFAEYREAIIAIDHQTQQDVQRAGFDEMLALMRELSPARDMERMRSATPEERQQLVAEMIANMDDPRWEHVQELRHGVEACIDRNGRRADARLAQLAGEIAQYCPHPERAHIEIMRFARRVLLDPRRDADSLDFVPSVDILRLTDDACASGGELHAVIAESSQSVSEEQSVAEDRVPSPAIRLSQIIEQYENELDQHLIGRLRERRRTRASSEPSQQVLADGASDRRTKRRARAWAERFAVSQRAGVAIAALAEECAGEAAAEAWWERFHTALCPELMRPRWLHRMVDWIEARSDHTAAQCEAAAEMERTYLVRWNDLRRRAITSGITQMKRRAYLHAPGPEERRHRDDVAALHALGRDTLLCFIQMLTPEQRAVLLGEFAGRRAGDWRVELIGPTLHPSHHRRMRTLLADALSGIGDGQS